MLRWQKKFFYFSQAPLGHDLFDLCVNTTLNEFFSAILRLFRIKNFLKESFRFFLGFANRLAVYIVDIKVAILADLFFGHEWIMLTFEIFSRRRGSTWRGNRELQRINGNAQVD